MEDVRSRIEAQVPGLSVEMAQLMEDLIGDLTAVPQPVEIKLFADNPAQLPAVAQGVADRIAKIPGIVSVLNGINPAGDARRVATLEPVAGQPEIDRENLRQMVAVTARISGRDMGSTVGDVVTALAQPGAVPKGVTYQRHAGAVQPDARARTL
jgi:Cu/Ag efflux pump CusA